jgi:DNA-directed RNA polymerase specialized sigma24 family protein
MGRRHVLDHSNATVTYGDVLLQLVRKAGSRTSDKSDAVIELAVCWLESGQWTKPCANPNAVKASIRNKARDLYRASRSERGVAVDAVAQGHDEESRLLARDYLAVIASTLQALDLQVLYLVAEGHTGPELAEQLGISHEAARARVSRARGHLA